MSIENNDDKIINCFHWESTFDATVVIDDCVYPNNYNVKVSFIPKVSDIKLQNNSFERIKYILNNICENSVIISPKSNLQSVFFKMPINKVLVPGDPYDQLLGICLYHKFNSIAGKFIHFESLTVDSKLGDNVQYTVDDGSYENRNLPSNDKWISDVIKEAWWYRNDTATFDQVTGENSHWCGAKTWRELGYGSDAKQRSFNPTVIDGGRDN
jgi:hypothetical protein